MQTKQIVQASANIIRITNLQQCDIYKSFEDSTYSKDVKYGIVRNIYNDGEKTYIEAQLISGELQQKLQTPVFKEVTQAEYNQKVREREALALG